jgi:adenosine deaminase
MKISKTPPLDPLAMRSISPEVAALPKADLHLHQEWSPRLDRVLARREGRAAYDWHGWASQLMAQVPPGMPRLERLSKIFPAPIEADVEPENFIARLEDSLEEGAADGAVLVELRFGGTTALQRPDFMGLFREAERRVRQRHPGLCAAAVYILLTHDEPERLERVAAACLRAARDGLSGIDFLYAPYDAEAEWRPLYRLAERAVDAGLGVTAHAGEFSTANIAAALRVPGLTRLGHAVYAAHDPRLLEAIASSGVTVECSLSCNVVLGAVSSYEDHPLRRFVEAGASVALGTDNPVQFCTTIGREYTLAHALGFTLDELLTFTRNAVSASFMPTERKRALLASLDETPPAQPRG